MATEQAMDPSVLSRLNQFSSMNRLKKLALQVSFHLLALCRAEVITFRHFCQHGEASSFAKICRLPFLFVAPMSSLEKSSCVYHCHRLREICFSSNFSFWGLNR